MKRECEGVVRGRVSVRESVSEMGGKRGWRGVESNDIL
jgi:hypothetical protein